MSLNIAHILKNKSKRILGISPHESVQNAAIVMAENGVGALLVLDQQKVVGIFTERDIVNKLFKDKLDPSKTTVSMLMSTKIIYALPTTTIEEAMATFTRYRFRHLPVLDNGRLIGVVSIGDITKWLLEDKQTEIKFLTEYVRGDVY